MRDIANCISIATIGAKIISATAIIINAGLPLLSLFLPPPPNSVERRKKSDTSVTNPTSTTATVETSMSRLPTCDSSCANTPSSSLFSIIAKRPVVTATTACSALRPVAKAFGAGSSMM